MRFFFFFAYIYIRARAPKSIKVWLRNVKFIRLKNISEKYILLKQIQPKWKEENFIRSFILWSTHKICRHNHYDKNHFHQSINQKIIVVNVFLYIVSSSHRFPFLIPILNWVQSEQPDFSDSLFFPLDFVLLFSVETFTFHNIRLLFWSFFFCRGICRRKITFFVLGLEQLKLTRNYFVSTSFTSLIIFGFDRKRFCFSLIGGCRSRN